MAKRLILEFKEDFLPKIKRRKVEFVKLLSKALETETGDEELSSRFGVVTLHHGEDHEQVVLNVDGDTIFRR